MNIAEIETNLATLVGGNFDHTTFPFSLLEIYDAPKATVAKLHQGSANHATTPGDVLWKHKLFFRAAAKGKVAAVIAGMSADALTKQHKPRFILATDGREVQCRDLKADQTLDIDYGKLNDRFDFLLPLAGIERYEPVAENPADVKAAGRLAKLYDAILEANPKWAGGNHTHELNLFMARMLFCFFAEDTSIFQKGLFSQTIFSMTKEDGSDTASVLQTLFTAMDREPNARKDIPEFAQRFPYVNGGLFSESKPIPAFSARARRLLKECGNLSWQDINPDIFGSMIQAVVEPGMRGDMGMHYTSVPNILKVLQPLFLLSLEAEFEAARDSAPKLQKLLARIYSIRVFDPACGSGNFLIIAYRELRKLENRVFARLRETTRQWVLPMTGVRLNHFYGIELADFAAETAKLSLWIAEYQMNEQFKTMFGASTSPLPLRESGNITHGNATQLDWAVVCPRSDSVEIYIAGNPPYLGSSMQNAEQKADLAHTFSHLTGSYKNLDYVACWYLQASEYIKSGKGGAAFVSTNSVCQGEQVGMLWPHIFQNDIEISFAHQAFKWKNNASHNAGVTCVIVGIRRRSKSKKVLYADGVAREVRNIGPYLLEMDDLIVDKVSYPISSRSQMLKGNQPTDGGHLILSTTEKEQLCALTPKAVKLVRRYFGSQEFIKGIERWCIWIEPKDIPLALSIPEVKRRMQAVRDFRLASPAPTTVARAGDCHRFIQIQRYGEAAVIVPSVSSEKRKYLPIGLVSADCIINNLAFGIYEPPDYLLSILSSRLHAIWTAVVGGQLETRLRYSNTLVYNTFPLPELSSEQITTLEDHAANILSAREAHPGKTVAWLYDPETMPNNLLRAHRDLDDCLETMYIGRVFKDDTERLEHLFKLYSVMTGKGQSMASAKKSTAVLEVA